MSIRSSSGTQPGGSANRRPYTRAFRRHVHELILLGYARLDHASHAVSDEPVITGEMIRAIGEALDAPHLPRRWFRWYSVHEDPRLNARGLKGVRRRQPDYGFEHLSSAPRVWYYFEAKRLNTSKRKGDYLGSKGLGCFLDGRYASECPEAGMIGYVQSDDEEVWAAAIRSRLESAPAKYGLRRDGLWHETRVVAGLEHTYQTRHDRKNTLPPIEIRHVLLKFC